MTSTIREVEWLRGLFADETTSLTVRVRPKNAKLPRSAIPAQVVTLRDDEKHDDGGPPQRGTWAPHVSTWGALGQLVGVFVGQAP